MAAMRLRNSGDWITFTISVLRRSSTPAGVPAGASTPNQVPMSKSLRPASLRVGTSARAPERLPVVTASARSVPAQVETQLQLSVNPPPLTDDTFDVCIRFGEPPDTRVIARFLAPNRRLLCAAPAYLARRGTPRLAQDLRQHNCIGIRQGEEAYGVWRLTHGRGRNARTESVRTRGNLTTNDGEIAVNWALDGHGIVMRAEWDVERHLKSGRLVQVLPQYATPDADICAVYPQRHRLAARVRAFVDFVALSFTRQIAGGRAAR